MAAASPFILCRQQPLWVRAAAVRWRLLVGVVLVTALAGMTEVAFARQDAALASGAGPDVHAHEAGASDAAAAQRAAVLSKTIESPFCPGLTLSACRSPEAAVWRQDIQRWTRQGVPSQQIRARLDARAQRPLSTVPSSGVSAWLALGSLAAALAGAGWIWRWLKRPASGAEPDGGGEPVDAPPPQPTAADMELDRRLDEELALLDT